MERNCEYCVYHSSGRCSAWECEGTKTIDDIRADERRKFSEWLINSKYHGICNDGFMYGVSDLHFKFNISSVDEISAEYEKEQK